MEFLRLQPEISYWSISLLALDVIFSKLLVEKATAPAGANQGLGNAGLACLSPTAPAFSASIATFIPPKLDF